MPKLRLPKKTEAGEQMAVMDWAANSYGRYPMLEHGLFHPANGEVRPKTASGFSPIGLKLKKMGVKSGTSDLVLLWPSGAYPFCVIEMKVGDNKPTDNQRAFLAHCRRAGAFRRVCYSADEAIAALEAYLSLGIGEKMVEDKFKFYYGNLRLDDAILVGWYMPCTLFKDNGQLQRSFYHVFTGDNKHLISRSLLDFLGDMEAEDIAVAPREFSNDDEKTWAVLLPPPDSYGNPQTNG